MLNLLQNLSEDRTDEFDQDSVAQRIYDLLQFYKMHKNSINQVCLEQHSKDHRLGYMMECMAYMDPCLPLLDKIQNDTLYLKEYLLKEG